MWPSWVFGFSGYQLAPQMQIATSINIFPYDLLLIFPRCSDDVSIFPFHVFPQPGLPWGSNSQEERSVRVGRAGGSPTTLRRFPRCSHIATQPHSHIATQPYSHIATQLHSHRATQPHSYIATSGRRPPPLWLCSYVAMWLCGHVAMQLCGYMAMWLCGYVAMWISSKNSKFPFHVF